MTTANPLRGGPRVIRQIQAPDAPWNGMLAEESAGGHCMLVDVGELVDDVAWRGCASGHLAGVRDLVRTPVGHLAVLPACTQRLEAFLGRRRVGDTVLSAGEAVTVAVSVVRGVSELVRLGAADAAGGWWLDDEGRPLLVGGGEQSARDAATAVLCDLLGDHDEQVADALRFACEVLADPRRVGREADAVEAMLFATAAPEPLATSSLSPVRMRRIETAGDEAPEAERAALSWWEPLVPHIDATLPEMASRAATKLWRRLRVDRPHRRSRPIVVAVALGAVVVAAGMLWPQGAEEPALAQPRHPTPTAPVTGTASPTRTADPTRTASATARAAPGDGVSLERIATALLERHAACSDHACLAATQEDAQARFTGGAQPLGAVTLLDDYGGAAVLRADADDGTARLVVMIRRDGEWLLRDIRDVAEQPEG